MAGYSAIIANIRQVGTLARNSTQTSGAWFDSRPLYCRVRNVVAPHFVVEEPGGFITADFQIPPEEAPAAESYVKQEAACWIFDGQTPIFYGILDSPTRDSTGAILCTVGGHWNLLATTRMREVWDDWDMTRLIAAPSNNKAGTVTVNSDGTLTLGFPNGSKVQNGEQVAADYFLWGEAVGGHDAKRITAFEAHISAADYGSMELDIYGKPSPGSGSADNLFSSTTAAPFLISKQGAQNLAASNQGSAVWPSGNGYRCIRIAFKNTSGGTLTLTADHFVTFDRFRVSTREGMFRNFSSAGLDTAAIARDVLNQRAEALDRFDIPMEFWRQVSTVNVNDAQFIYGQNGSDAEGEQRGDPVTGTGTADNQGVKLTGFNVQTWMAPTQILTALSQIDGMRVGFYFPQNPRSGTFNRDPAVTTILDWPCAPPQLVYTAWSNIYAPDYLVSIGEGAVIEPNTTPQPLVNAEYVNYQTLAGRGLSVVVDDVLADPTYGAYQNWLTAQGYRRAEDYTISPSIGSTDGSTVSTAQSLGKQIISVADTPVMAGTITISQDRNARYPIRDSLGAVPPKLALLRPGVYRVTDLPGRKTATTGRATKVEWWGCTLDTPEHVEITMNQVAEMRQQRTIQLITWRRNHTIQ